MWLAGQTYDGDQCTDLRNSDVTAMLLDAGVLGGQSVIGVLPGVIGNTGLGVTPGTGMTVTVGPGSFAVPNSASPVAGGYRSTLPQAATLDVTAADPSNPRIDVVCATVADNGDATSGGTVQVITGLPAATPSAPSVPDNSIVLAAVSVPANLTAIAAANITDQRTYTVAAGGVARIALGSQVGYAGMLAYDRSSDRFYHNGANGQFQASFAPFDAVQSANTGNVNLGHQQQATTVCSVSFTADGQTDVKVTSSDCGTYVNFGNANVSYWVYKHWSVDGTTVFGYNTAQHSAIGQNYSVGGGTTVLYSGTGGAFPTPSAGTHTIKFWATEFGSTTATDNAFLLGPAFLRVEAVPL